MKKKNKTHRRVGGIMNRTDIPFAKRLKMQHNGKIIANRKHAEEVTLFIYCASLNQAHRIGYKRLVRYSLDFKAALDDIYKAEDIDVGLDQAKRRLAQYNIEISGELYSVIFPGLSVKEQEIQDNALQASQIAQVAGTIAMNDTFKHGEKKLKQTLAVVNEMSAKYAKKGDGFLLEKMQEIGFEVINGKVTAFLGDDGKAVTCSQALKDGILDGHKDVKKWAEEEKITRK